MQSKHHVGDAGCPATDNACCRARADSTSEEETTLLTPIRRGSAPVFSKSDSQSKASTCIPLSRARIRQSIIPLALSDDHLQYDATVETILRFAHAVLASPRASESSLSRIPSTPRIKVTDYDDPVANSTPLSHLRSSGTSCSNPRSSSTQRKESKKGRKRLSTAEMREQFAAESKERTRCMRRFL